MRAVLGLMAAVLGLLSIQPAAATPSLAAYGRLPSLSQVELSPGGDYIALVIGDESHRQIQVRRVDDHKMVTGTELGKVKIRGVQWAGDGHLIVTKSSAEEVFGIMGPKREYSQAVDLDVKKKKWRLLLADQANSLNTVAGPPTLLSLNGRAFAFITGYTKSSGGNVYAQTLYKVDLDGGYTSKVADGRDDTIQWMVDTSGRPSARADYDQVSGRWSLWLNQKDGWRKSVSETDLLDTPGLLASGADAKTIVMISKGGDQPIWRPVSATDGVWADPMELGAKVDAVVIDPQSRTLIGTIRVGPTSYTYTFLDPADQKAWDMVAKAFPKADVGLASWTADRTKVVAKVEGSPFGVAYYYIDLNTKRADPLGDVYSGVSPDDVAEQRYLTYAAADGLTLPAYLTLPQGRPAKALPLVVLVHGGPAVRDQPGFDWMAQAIASRGYAVLQPEYRGSNGFGRKFLEAGFGQWGLKMQTDVSDGVRSLAKQGIIDPKRVCIAGASYGGYAALAGAVFDHGVYRCAVADAPPADLRALLSYEEDMHNSSRNESVRYWDRFMGAGKANDPHLDAISPARHADQADIPILLIHGQDDTVVPYEQSKIMANALKRAGKPVQFVTLKGEDHWLSRSETRLQMVTAMMGFIEANNPPDSGAPDATKTAAVASGAVSH